MVGRIGIGAAGLAAGLLVFGVGRLAAQEAEPPGAGAPGEAGPSAPDGDGAVGVEEPGVAVPEPVEDRIPGFCDACQAKAQGPLIESSAQCAVCKTGWTASGMFRACDACAGAKGICKICLKPLQSGKGSGGAGDRGEGRARPEPRRRTIGQVQADYGDDLMALRGVVGHGIGGSEEKPVLVVFAETQQDAARLDALLSDAIEGHPLKIEVTGKIEAR